MTARVDECSGEASAIDVVKMLYPGKLLTINKEKNED